MPIDVYPDPPLADLACTAGRLRSAALADQIQGAVIVWDSVAEVFNVRGGAVSPDNPGGRVRAVIAPRGVNEAAAAASSGLRPSPTLGDRR